MTDLKEKHSRVCVKFVSLREQLQLKLSQCSRKASKNKSTGKTQVYEWFNRFKRDETSVEDQPRCGRLSTSRTEENVDKVHHAVLADRLRTIDEISEITGVSCRRILTLDLMVERVAAKFVICRKSSKLTLSFSQKL